MLKKHIVRLSADERALLLELIDSGKGGKEKQNRARILLKADVGENGESWKDSDIAKALYVSRGMVEQTRKSLVEDGFEETINRRLPSIKKRRIIEGEEEAYLVAMVCGKPPEGHCKWTLRLLANSMVELSYVPSVSHETIRKSLKKTNLNPGKKRNGVFRQNPTPVSSVKWKKSLIST